MPTSPASTPARGWLFFLGGLSLLLGVAAIAFPLAATVAIEQVLGILLVASGVAAIVGVIFGDERNHRIATSVLALIRIAAGLVFLILIKPGVLALTIALGAFFVAEGIVSVAASLALRHNRAWPLMLANGLVTLLLGGLVFAQFPSSAAWMLGLLYGINALFSGTTLLGFAAARKSS